MNSPIYRKKLYFLVVLASYIPIITYILFPGQNGVPTLIQALLVFYVYNKVDQRLDFVRNKFCFSFLLILLIGAFRPILNMSLSSNDMSIYLVQNLSFVPFLVCTIINEASSIKSIIYSYIVISIPVALISYLFWDGFLLYDIPHVFAPLTLCLLLSPFFGKKYTIIICLLLIWGTIYDYSIRSCLLSVVFSLSFYLIYITFSQSTFERIAKMSRFIFFFFPLICLLLSLFADINFFEEIEKFDMGDIGTGRKSDTHSINIDSRTIVYYDIYLSIDSMFSLFFGHGSTYQLESLWMDNRNSVEAGILNIFLNYGLLGCISLFLLMWRASFLGLFRTNNCLTMMASLFVSYKFMYLFIEEPTLDTSTFLALGICMSPLIRKMSNSDFCHEMG